MSFGTGHHATTYGMIELMLALNFFDKIVLDMGCGTAVLAILADQLGAKKVVAIDIEECAYNNALENISINRSSQIVVHKGGKEKIEGKFNIILANINRNTLIKDMNAYSSHLNENGLILFSGFYEQDLDLIKHEANLQGLKYIGHNSKNNWVTANSKTMKAIKKLTFLLSILILVSSVFAQSNQRLKVFSDDYKVFLEEINSFMSTGSASEDTKKMMKKVF